MDKDFGRNANTYISVLGSIASIMAVIIARGAGRIVAAAALVLALLWLALLIRKNWTRRRTYRRLIGHPGGEEQAIGFNGATAYSKQDYCRFYGRSADIVEICAQIQHEDYRLGVLYGESGVGKTSLIQAGLIRTLEAKGMRCAYMSLNHLPRSEETNDLRFMQFITSQLARKLEISEQCDNLQLLAQRINAHKHGTTVVFLDQFEQVFDRTRQDGRSVFARELRTSSQELDGSLKYVISVRSDYFGLVYQMFEVHKGMNVSMLEKFNARQAREIIRRSLGYDEDLNKEQPDHPLLKFEDEIIDDLQDGDGRIHPVEVSLICWIMLKTVGALTVSAYLQGGRKQGWLDHYLDVVLYAVPNQRAALKVLNALIGGDKSDTLTAESIAARAEVEPSETQKLLDYLEENRIIVKEAGEYVSSQVPPGT